jgi:gas vesicle protein GvpO
MTDLSDAQRKRAEGRQQRRGKADAEPADDAVADSVPESTGDEQPLDSVKHAAKLAAAGVAVGAAAAAARALTSHRDGDGAEAPEAEAEEERAQETEDQADQQDERAAQSEPEAREDDEPQRERFHEPEPDPEPVEGAEPSEAKATIDNAREQLEDLLGRPVEEVSSLERTHDGWVVALEVVELARVPESTDVLASYEMELDENRNLRRYQQVRRYHRAQADRGDEA